jgi:hypothetical protein
MMQHPGGVYDIKRRFLEGMASQVGFYEMRAVISASCEVLVSSINATADISGDDFATEPVEGARQRAVSAAGVEHN